MAKRRRREYLQLLDAAKDAVVLAVDCFNRVRNPYRDESALLLLTNAWELLAKAVLVQRHESIARGRRGDTISAEVAIDRIKASKLSMPCRPPRSNRSSPSDTPLLIMFFRRCQRR